MIRKLLTQKPLIIGCLIFYTALVCYLSLARMDGPGTIQVWDKAAHACVYFGFAVLSGLLAGNRKQFLLWLTFWFCFGILIEILQGYTGYRFASAADQVANFAGLIIGTAFHTLVNTLYLKK